jgi:hypothetical protein
MRAKRNAYRILVGKEGKRLLGRPRRRWVNNTKMVIWTGFIWLRIWTNGGFCEHGNELRGFHKMLGNSLVAVSQEGLSCME